MKQLLTNALDDIKDFCAKAGLEIEKIEAAKKFRMHLVARKVS